MDRPPPISTRTYTLIPYTTSFLSRIWFVTSPLHARHRPHDAAQRRDGQLVGDRRRVDLAHHLEAEQQPDQGRPGAVVEVGARPLGHRLVDPAPGRAVAAGQVIASDFVAGGVTPKLLLETETPRSHGGRVGDCAPTAGNHPADGPTRPHPRP